MSHTPKAISETKADSTPPAIKGQDLRSKLSRSYTRLIKNIDKLESGNPKIAVRATRKGSISTQILKGTRKKLKTEPTQQTIPAGETSATGLTKRIADAKHVSELTAIMFEVVTALENDEITTKESNTLSMLSGKKAQNISGRTFKAKK